MYMYICIYLFLHVHVFRHCWYFIPFHGQRTCKCHVEQWKVQCKDFIAPVEQIILSGGGSSLLDSLPSGDTAEMPRVEICQEWDVHVLIFIICVNVHQLLIYIHSTFLSTWWSI